MGNLKKATLLLLAFLGLAEPLSVTEKPFLRQHQEAMRQKAFAASLEGRISSALNNFTAENIPISTRYALNDLLAKYNGANPADQEEKNRLGREFLLMLKYPYPIEIIHHDVNNWKAPEKKLSIDTFDVLYNTDEWERLLWKDWDYVPSDLLMASLRKQFDQYRDAFDAERWPAMTNRDWNKIPGPVKTAAFMVMIKQASEEYELDKRIKEGLAHHWFASIIFCESYFENNAENRTHRNKDLGLSQLSPYARAKLSRTRDFRSFREQDFAKPYYSIRGGVKWFEICLEEARNDLPLAIKTYRAGIVDAKENTANAQDYEMRVKQLFSRYFERKGVSRVWDHILSVSAGKNP
ncbi:MAG: transglycosylase SLT domain-containing protein [archaeon]